MLIVDFDRFLMGYSLGVHIILASIGIALPVIILIAEYLGIRNNDVHYRALAKRLAIVFVVLFAIGTASGTLVALEILLLWPKFMALVSQVSILPFYIETFAFFMESIFLAIYFYSWDRFKNRFAHLLTGIPIAIGSALSGVLITMINAWMNTPNGFNIPAYLANGTVTGVQPLAVFNTPSTAIEVSHVLASSYFSGILVFAMYLAFMLLVCKDEQKKLYYRKGLGLVIVLAMVSTIAAVATGLVSISSLVSLQPEKYAAIEGNINSTAFAPERIGGIPIGNNSGLAYFIPIPGAQSMLATGSLNGTVPGLSSYPHSTWPPLIIHLFFDIMVGVGFAIAGLMALIVLLYLLRRNPIGNRIILWLVVAAGVLGLVILELGWVLAELGRQPWIIYNVMLVSDAANYSASVIPATALILVFYIAVIPATLLILRRIFRDRPLENELVNQ
ncbi:MAG: cytochrome ubiquinol oxidase subunit I [Candidatus Micrarchaeota archaeon]|nr:cytochrome ubiquinol oxidase subunit I [Candidatus Micrarchaeota archaeon]